MTQEEKELKKIQWTGDNLKEVIEFTGRSPKFDEWFKTWEEYEEYVRSHGNIFKMFFEDGSHYEVPVGSWIIKTPDGMNIPYTVTIGSLVKYEDESRLLLLKDLCARLPYGVKYCRESWNYEWDQEMSVVETLEDIDKDGYINDTKVYKVWDIKPYLRQMSSMTEKEKEYIKNRWCYNDWDIDGPSSLWREKIDVEDAEGIIDYFNEHHFDYRGLIPIGLALEAPEGMYEIG